MKHSDDDVFVHASQMPDRRPDPDRLESFEVSLLAGLENVEMGTISAIGRDFISQGIIAEREIYEDRMAMGDRTDPEGTPGRGVPLENRYEASERVNRTAILRAQARHFRRQAENAILHAQRAEDRGDMRTARHFDAVAENFLTRADSTERQIQVRRDIGGR